MLPTAFSERMHRLLGAEFDDFLASYERPRNTGLRFNPLKGEPRTFPFCAEPIPWEKNGFYLTEGARPALNPCHDAGVYYLQEPSAMAPAGLLAPQPGEWVLDLCAAPGGKTTQIAAAMQGRGLLVCNELHPKRAKVLASNIERMGVANALVLNEHPTQLAARFSACFDRILVDAPCSGEGMFRKEADAVTDWSEEAVKSCAARQTEILNSAAEMLRAGGRLVYSTCTFSPEENEGVIDRFLQEHSDFSVEIVDAPFFDGGRPEWIGSENAALSHTFRLFPHKLRGEGHFAAVLRRSGEAARRRIEAERLLPMPQPVEEFLREGNVPVSGGTVSFGETCFLAPDGLPELRGLKVVRVGLELGEVRKSRFVPAHALAAWLKDFPQKVSFSHDSDEIAAYLRGETLQSSLTGWVLICVEGYSLGWAKGSDGVLKNHYPKGLRRLK